ncbi:MAG: hypothetical protein OEW12_00930 [Deltaproteobacteria bacterium]|nr:hypothetical protein [Deltaproteobacteria bacterium]
MKNPFRRFKPFCIHAGLTLLTAGGVFLAGISSPALGQGVPGGLAQADFAGNDLSGFDGGAVFVGQPRLFSESGKVKILLLALNPFEITESAAEQISLILEKNLSNTGHFSVVGFREANAYFDTKKAELVDCRQIACGVESGKMLGADRVLVGTIHQKADHIQMTIRVINVSNNLTDFRDEIHFTDDNMDDQLFRLSNSISSNTLIVGRVLSTSIRGIVVDMGEKQGLRIGDFMVVFKQEVPINNLEGENIDTQRKNVAIVKVLRVNATSSEAILIHSVEDPQANFLVQTYLNPARQTALLEDTRRELDTGIRLENKIKPMELAPVMLADTERKRWQYKMNAAEGNESFWYMMTGAGGVATLVAMNLYQPTAQGQLQLGGALAFAGYSFWEVLNAREKTNEVKQEGRAKGYVISPVMMNDGFALAAAFRF